MIGELAGENTSDVSLIHYGDKGVVSDVRDVDEGVGIHVSYTCYWLIFIHHLLATGATRATGGPFKRGFARPAAMLYGVILPVAVG
jgi:hypothetical protein